MHELCRPEILVWDDVEERRVAHQAQTYYEHARVCRGLCTFTLGTLILTSCRAHVVMLAILLPLGEPAQLLN